MNKHLAAFLADIAKNQRIDSVDVVREPVFSGDGTTQIAERITITVVGDICLDNVQLDS